MCIKSYLDLDRSLQNDSADEYECVEDIKIKLLHDIVKRFPTIPEWKWRYVVEKSQLIDSVMRSISKHKSKQSRIL
jgi:hypothetical protein